MSKWADLFNLARWIIVRRPVLFVGSGLSMNCGCRSAEDLAVQLARAVAAEVPHLPYSGKELERRARLLGLSWIVQEARVRCKWSDDRICAELFNACWPPEGRYPWLTLDEWIEYHSSNPVPLPVGIPQLIIARLAREGLVSEIFTTNYDCMLELACWSIGMTFGPRDPVLTSRPDPLHTEPTHYTACRHSFAVIDSRSYWCMPRYASTLYISKMHGRIDDAIDPVRKTWKHPNQLVLAWEDLVSWNKSAWAKSFFYDRACSSMIMLTGFSASDPYLFASFREALSLRRLYSVDNTEDGIDPSSDSEADPAAPGASVVIIDPNPGTYLRALVKADSDELAHSTGNGTNLAIQLGKIVSNPPCRDGEPCFDKRTCIYGRRGDGRSELSRICAGVFRDLFMAVVLEILRGNLDTVGIRSFIEFGGSARQAHGYAELGEEKVRTFLEMLKRHDTKWPPGFSRTQLLTDFIPAALGNSWLAEHPLEASMLPSIWQCRHNFYVPLLENMKSLYVLVLFVACLIDAVRTMKCGLKVWENGSLELTRPGGSAARYRLLPVVVGELPVESAVSQTGDPDCDGSGAGRYLEDAVLSAIFPARYHTVPELRPVLLTNRLKGSALTDGSLLVVDLRNMTTGMNAWVSKVL